MKRLYFFFYVNAAFDRSCVDRSQAVFRIEVTRVQVERYLTAAEFLAATEPTLLLAEAENALLLGIVSGVAARATPATDAPYFAAVWEGRDLSVAAFRTLPDKLGLTRASNLEALAPLALDVQAACPGAVEVLGPEPTAGTFASELARLRAQQVHRRFRQRIYELRQITPRGQAPSGRLRPAHAADTDLLTGWAEAFSAVVGDRGDPRAVVEARIAAGELYLWEDGQPVSMAAWAGKTRNGVRINFVFTPPELRGHGYATAAVSALSQRMLDEGNRFCCLYTDLANPTSNSIYQKIGYRPVCDAAVYAIA
jgi:predicted GNAT family acetyltransferase